MDGMTILKLTYDMLLESEVPGLSMTLKANPKAYEMAFKHWLDKTTDEAIAAVKLRNSATTTKQGE